MRCLLAFTFACMTLALAARSINAQAPPQTQAPLVGASSTLVLVPALVRNKSGELIYTLNAEDFVLTDNGVPQKLRLEQDSGSEPLALVVVIEAGGAGARELGKLGALAPMIESIVGNVPHQVAVVAFDSHPTLVQSFTPVVETAASAIAEIVPACSSPHNCAATPSTNDISVGDNGAAILDSLGFSVDLLRQQPSTYRRAILLISETLDRGSHLTLEEALRSISDTNTAIYSIGFSTGKSEASHYAHRELPTQPSEPKGSWLSLANHHPNPPHGCMGKDPDPDPDATHNKAVQAYDCLTQLAPPLALAKMAAIAATDGMRRNIPETVANLTGGEYFKLTDAKSLERSLATISNHVPNQYVLSFQPSSPAVGLHAIDLRLANYSNLQVTARSSYWFDPGTPLPSQQPSPVR